MKFKKIVFLILCIITTVIQAQVGIGTTSPDASSILDITATDKGVLVPRVSLIAVSNSTNPIVSPATGLLVWNTNASVTGGNGIGFYFYNGAQWQSITGVQKIDDLLDGKSDSDGTQDGSSLFLGIDAGTFDDSSDNQNVGIGAYSMYSNTTGYQNVALGRGALTSNTTGFLNTAVGYSAMNFRPVNGRYNTAIGALTLNLLVNAQHNTAVGYRALYATNGGNNTAMGNESMLFNTSGAFNTAMGNQSLYSNDTGVRNTALGTSALYSNTSGNNNIAIGYNAGYFEIGSNKLYIENSNSTTPLVYGEFDNDLLRINGTLDINNAYQLPNTDGTANQLMQTDGSGTVSWVDANTIGNDGHDFYEEGTTSAPDDINDDIFTLGNLAIGKNIANYPLEVYTPNNSTFGNRLLNIQSDFSSTYITGIYTNLSNGLAFGGEFILTGTDGNNKYGLRTDITYNGSESFGLKNEITSEDISTNYGVYNVLDNASTSSNTFYGLKNDINAPIVTNSPDTKYGVYNELLGGVSVKGMYNEIISENPIAVDNIITSLVNTNNAFGVKSSFSGEASSFFGSRNDFNSVSTNNANHYGSYNGYSDYDGNNYGMFNFFPNGIGSANNIQFCGVQNSFETSSILNNSYKAVGVNNDFNINASSTSAQLFGTSGDLIVGLNNDINLINDFTTDVYGVRNILEHGDNAYGIFNEIRLVDNNAYGVYSDIIGGGFNNYGIYSRVNSSTSGDNYAGYFIGAVSINGELSINNYNFPTNDGTSNQIMQTDGAGNVSWVDDPSPSYWTRTGGVLNLATATDDISFLSDQTSITFPASTGTPQPMLYMFSGGTNNANKMVISHSTGFSNYGLLYNDVDDSFQFLRAGTNVVEIDLFGTNEVLTVNGDIGVNGDIVTDTTTYPDYVFEMYYEGTSSLKSDYQFMPLSELEKFIKKEKHLPNVKSYEEIESEGMTISVGEMTISNLEKIEEAFLYIIELKKENDLLKEKLETQQQEINEIKNLLKN